MKLTFGVDATGDMKIGFRTNNDTGTDEAGKSGHGWFKVDNFKLFYKSTEIPTAIGTVKAGADEDAQIVGQEYYNAGGVRVATPQRGVTIVRNILSDGSVKTTKVIR